MARWINRSDAALPPSGTALTFTYDFEPAAGNFLLLLAVSGSTLGTPSGWTLLQSAVSGRATYAWTKAAGAGETSVTIPVTVADWPAVAVMYEFPAGSTIMGSNNWQEAPLSGVAAPTLSGLTADPKVLMHVAGYSTPATSGATLGSVAWEDDTANDITNLVQPAVGSADGALVAVGFIEDSLATSWAPRLFLDGQQFLHDASDRVTLAVDVAEAVQLDTPVVVVTNETDPTTPGGTDGSITVSWDPIANADHYEAGIASGHDQTAGFTVVSTNAVSPYVFQNLAAGDYTVAIRAMPSG